MKCPKCDYENDECDMDLSEINGDGDETTIECVNCRAKIRVRLIHELAIVDEEDNEEGIE